MNYKFSKYISEDAIKVQIVNTDNVEKFLSSELLKLTKFEGKYKQILHLPESKSVYIGVTKESTIKSIDVWNKVDYYELGANLVNSLAKTNYSKFVLEGFSNTDNSIEVQKENLMRFCLGMYQAAWHLDSFLPENKAKTKKIILSISESDIHLKTLELEKEIDALTKGIILTRELIELPPQVINPSTIGEKINSELGDNPNISITLLDKAKLEQMKMGAFLAVGRASIHAPVLAHIVLTPSKNVKHRIALIGKGLTYDSGGLDIKISGFMKTMKIDMGGAATMFGIIKALSLLKLNHTEVHWISAFAENMLGGDAYKADDILTSYSGQTIEVFNTDAEGRLTLADALTYATLQNPDYIIDAATLTGACMRAVTEYFTALMGNDQELIDSLQEAFIEEQEKTVYVPMAEILREQVQGEIADLINTGKDPSMGGHITAGLFLSHFVDQNLFRNSELDIHSPKAYKWAHLDIAGSVYNKYKNSIGVDGATGQTVRSLVKFIQKIDIA